MLCLFSQSFIKWWQECRKPVAINQYVERRLGRITRICWLRQESLAKRSVPDTSKSILVFDNTTNDDRFTNLINFLPVRFPEPRKNNIFENRRFTPKFILGYIQRLKESDSFVAR